MENNDLHNQSNQNQENNYINPNDLPPIKEQQQIASQQVNDKGFNNQQQFNNQNYANQQQMNNGHMDDMADKKPVSIGEWILIEIIMLVPIVNLIVLLIWALDENVNKSKSNFCKAKLIMMVATTVIGIILVVIAIAMVGSLTHGIMRMSQFSV